MPREGSFSYQIRARAQPAEVVTLLSDLSRHPEFHPLIVRVTQVPPPEGVLRRYKIVDRLALGPLTFLTAYTADVVVVDPDRVVILARQRPAVTVRNETRVSVVDGDAVADVTVTLTAPAPLFGFALRQARAAHAVLAERLRSALAPTGAGVDGDGDQE